MEIFHKVENQNENQILLINFILYYTTLIHSIQLFLQGSIIPEMLITTNGNLPQNPTNRKIEPNGVVDVLSEQNQNPPESCNQTASESDIPFEACNEDNSNGASDSSVIPDKSTTDVSASTTTSEFPSCEIPSKQTKPLSNGISSKTSNETTSDPSSPSETTSDSTSSSDTLTQSSIQALSIESIHTPLQNTESKSLIATTQSFTSTEKSTNEKNATFPEEAINTSSSLTEHENTLVPENNPQNLPTEQNTLSGKTQFAINGQHTNEAEQIPEKIQIQQSLPVTHAQSSDMQTSPSLSTQISSTEVPESETETETVPESLALIPDKNSAILNSEVSLNT